MALLLVRLGMALPMGTDAFFVFGLASSYGPMYFLFSCLIFCRVVIKVSIVYSQRDGGLSLEIPKISYSINKAKGF